MAHGSPFLILAGILFLHASACEFYVTAVGCCPANEAFVGNWIRDGGPWHKGKRMYKHVDNYQQVFQWAGNSKATWDMCYRDAETGPSTCGENSAGTGRNGYTNNGVDAPSGNIKNWCSQSNCVFKVRAPPCPTSTSTSTATGTGTTSTAEMLDVSTAAGFTSTAELLDVSTAAGFTSTVEMLDVSTAAGSAEFSSTPMAVGTSTRAGEVWTSSAVAESTAGLESSLSAAGTTAAVGLGVTSTASSSLLSMTEAVPGTSSRREEMAASTAGGASSSLTSQTTILPVSSTTQGFFPTSTTWSMSTSAAESGGTTETVAAASEDLPTSTFEIAASSRGPTLSSSAADPQGALLPLPMTTNAGVAEETSNLSPSSLLGGGTTWAARSNTMAPGGVPATSNPEVSTTIPSSRLGGDTTGAEQSPAASNPEVSTTIPSSRLGGGTTGAEQSSTISPGGVPATSNPEASTTWQGDIMAIILEAEQQSGALLRTLTSSNETKLSSSSEMGLIVSAKLAPVAGEGQVATVLMGSVQVSVPLAIFEGLMGPGEEPAIVAMTFLPEFAPHGGKGLLSLDLAALASSGGRALDTGHLAAPIAFTLPLTYEAGLACAYWDEDQGAWSTAGVSLGEASKPGGPMHCVTSHLSLFAAIIQGALSTLACSQASLLSYEAMRVLGSGDWYGHPGSIFFWVLVGIFLLAFLLAAFLDRRQSWPSNLFLFMGEEPAPAAGQGPSLVRAKSEELAKSGCSFLAAFAAVQGSSALQDACDDIMSNWCDYFGELRSFLADVLSDIDIFALSFGHAVASLRKMMHGLNAASARNLAGGCLCIDTEAIDFVLEDEEFKVLLAERQGCADEDFGEREQAWLRLYGEVCGEVEKQLQQLWSRSSLYTCARLFCMNHFAVRLFYLDVFVDRRTRLLLLFTDQVLQLSLATFFFEAAGGRRRSAVSAQGCDDMEGQEEFGHLIGRFMAIAAASAVFAALPMNLLESLQTKCIRKVKRREEARVLRAWRIQMRLIYLFAGLLISFNVFFIHLFLSNVTGEDQQNWLLSLCLVLLQDWLLVPLALAFLYPLLSRILRLCSSRSRDVADLQLEERTLLYRDTNMVFHPL